MPAEAIRNFDEEMAIFNIQNNYEGSNKGDNNIYSVNNENNNCTFNPLEKYIEVIEENKKLYERLLQSEKEKNELLQKIINELK